MKLKLEFYGMIAESLGGEEMEISDFQGNTISELKDFLHRSHPFLKTLTYTVALNNKLAGDMDLLSDHASVALMPPFSGG